jgi:hypothetical protein
MSEYIIPLPKQLFFQRSIHCEERDIRIEIYRGNEGEEVVQPSAGLDFELLVELPDLVLAFRGVPLHHNQQARTELFRGVGVDADIDPSSQIAGEIFHTSPVLCEDYNEM